MARIRSIKPEFWTDGKIVKLEPLARLFFIGSWNFARCDTGHLDDDAMSLKLRIIPTEEVDAEKIVNQIISVGLIDRYESDGRTFLKIRRFTEHQKTDDRWTARCPYCSLTNSTKLTETRATSVQDRIGEDRRGEDRIGIKTYPSGKKSQATSRSHPRLEIFCQEYRQVHGRAYVVGSFAEEGGAARRTVAKVPDDIVFRRAVRAYLAATDKRIVEASYPFLWFIRELNRWSSFAEGGINAKSEFERRSQGLREFLADDQPGEFREGDDRDSSGLSEPAISEGKGSNHV